MSRAAAAAAVALAILAASCARHGDLKANAPSASASGSSATEGHAAPSAPPPNKPPLAILAPTPDEGEVLLHVTALRAHPLGARVEPFVAAWPGWSDTLEAFAPHPLADLEWVDVVGPAKAAGERLLARTASDDGAIDVRIEALASGSTESAKPFVDGDVSHAAAARVDGLLRVVARPEPHLVVASSSDASRALTHALAAARIIDPEADADEILRADIPHPHAALPLVPEEVRHVHARVSSRPGGAAEAIVELVCDDDAAAQRTAAALRALVARFDNAIVRMLTHGLFAHVSIEVAPSESSGDSNSQDHGQEGQGQGQGQGQGHAIVTARIAASREQLESLLPLAIGMLPPRQGSGRAPRP